MAGKGFRLHNALATIRTRWDFRIHAMNLSDRAVHFPKSFVVGLVIPYDGHVLEVPSDYLPTLNEGADFIVTLGTEPVDASVEEPSTVDRTPKACAGTRVPLPDTVAKTRDGSPGPMPKVAYELIPSDLHPAVRELSERKKGLWDGKLGRNDMTPHRINLMEGARLIRSLPFRSGLHHRDLIKDHVGKQAKLGVIEPSLAEWSLPAVLVPKPDGSSRFCEDYRRPDDVTDKNTYPLPRMDDCKDFLGEATFFSTFDANCGYLQIHAAAEDQDKTTFTCHEVTYRYQAPTWALKRSGSVSDGHPYNAVQD